MGEDREAFPSDKDEALIDATTSDEVEGHRLKAEDADALADEDVEAHTLTSDALVDKHIAE